MAQVLTIPIAPGLDYFHHPDHRNSNPNKSQWTITREEERASFSQAFAEDWLRDTDGWGLHTPSGLPEYLGTALDRKVFVAKFVGGPGTPWHGYPADHQQRAQDIPHEAALQSWMNLGLLTAPKIRKIAKGQRCNL